MMQAGGQSLQEKQKGTSSPVAWHGSGKWRVVGSSFDAPRLVALDERLMRRQVLDICGLTIMILFVACRFPAAAETLLRMLDFNSEAGGASDALAGGAAYVCVSVVVFCVRRFPRD